MVQFEFHPCLNQYDDNWSAVRFEFHPCLNQYNDNWSVVRFEFHPWLLSFSISVVKPIVTAERLFAFPSCLTGIKYHRKIYWDLSFQY